MPGSDHPTLRDVRPHMIIGHNVHDACLDDALGMIETQPMRCTPAAVVTCDHEALVSEVLHDLDEIACHLAKAEIDVIGPRIGQRAVAVAAQVRKNDMVLLGQLPSDLVPAGVVFRYGMGGVVGGGGRRGGAAELWPGWCAYRDAGSGGSGPPSRLSPSA